MIKEKDFKKFAIIALIGVLIILSFLVIKPILSAILYGLLLAYIFNPVYIRVLKIVREKNISALIIMLLIIFLLFIPLWFLFPLITRQIIEAYSFSQKIDIAGLFQSILPAGISTDTIAMVNNAISKIVNAILAKSSSTLLNLPDLMLQAAVVLFVFFFALRDSDKLKAFVKAVSPLSKKVEENLSKQFRDITGSVIYGHIIVGILQGILTGIGLLIFGSPQALLLTVVAILAAVIPIIGAWLVWIPASLYLIISGHTGAGIGLFLYGAILVSWIDNILKPYIVAKKANVSSVIVLVGMIGGLLIFGIIGLILGPLVLSYLIVLLESYKDKKLIELFG